MRKTIFLFALISMFLCQPGFSQSKKEKRKAKKEAKMREGKPMITPLAGPAYTPELGFTIAGGVMVSLKLIRRIHLFSVQLPRLCLE